MQWGLDGARGGWILARLDSETSSGAQVNFCASLDEVARYTCKDRVHVDMPIGLAGAEAPARDWDARARKLLRGRLSSRVFTPPIREVLECASYSEANARSKELIAKGISVQAWNIVPKIRELDRFLNAHPNLEVQWEEAHPEIAFSMLNGRQPILASKKTSEGLGERIELLRNEASVSFEKVWSELESIGVRGRFLKDDVLDALALSAVESAFP